MPTTSHAHHVLDTDIPIFRPIPGVLDPRLLSQVLYSLEGKSEVPVKFAYFGNGVQSWKERSIKTKEELVSFNLLGKNNFGDETKLINDTLNLVVGSLSEKSMVNIVDIGTGTGYVVYPILSYLQDKKKLGKYIAIDIVEEMCDLAINNLTNIEPLTKMKTSKYLHDFEDGHFADIMIKERKEGVANLFTFFGSTLGNAVDRHRALANIRDSMTEGDLLWIGIDVYTNADNLVKLYRDLKINSPEYLARNKFLMSFLEYFGMKDWMNYGSVIVGEADNQGLLKYNFVIKKPFIIEIPSDTNKIQLKYQIGDKITFGKLKNYKEHDLIGELKEAGFKLRMLNVSDDYRTALVLVSV